MLVSCKVGALCPRRHRLQKLFSSFPDGWAGIGLVLLRLAVALNAMLQGVVALATSSDAAAWLWVISLCEIVAGLALLIGFVTPVAGVLTSIVYFGAGSWLFLHNSADVHGSAFAALNLAAMSIALVLLGPGAFSVDARVFGRREIIIPEARRPPL